MRSHLQSHAPSTSSHNSAPRTYFITVRPDLAIADVDMDMETHNTPTPASARYLEMSPSPGESILRHKPVTKWCPSPEAIVDNIYYHQLQIE